MIENLTHVGFTNHASGDALQLPMVELPPFEAITKQQMHKALIYFDALTKVENALANAEPEVQQAWQNARKFNREDKYLSDLAKKAQITDLQLDFIFEVGATM